VPPFRPECLTPSHMVSGVKATHTTDLDSAIRARVQTLNADPTLFVLGLIRCGPREALIVSQRPVTGDVAVSVQIKDKGQ
jgi:hypothetical protein